MAGKPSRGASGAAGFTPLRLFQILLLFAIMGATQFIAAGRLDWVGGWTYLSLFAATTVYRVFFFVADKPDLTDERFDVPSGAKTWDRVLTTILIPLSTFGIALIAGLDRRYGWSAAPSVGARWAGLIAGLGLYMAGYALTLWAIRVNPFFSRVVRIQTDRGHAPVTDGPYRYVRHPGYVGGLMVLFSTPLIFGSVRVWIVVLVILAGMLLRTHLEDRTLQEELPGYKEYAQRTRYRLLPGVW